mgnify:CR=1 FL=1
MAPRSAALLVPLILFQSPSEALAGATVGLSWTPLPADESLQSGLSVGEFDGLIQPALTPYAGWTWDRNQLLGNLNWAIFSSAKEAQRSTLGTLRIGLDYRRLFPDLLEDVRGWLGVGVYQIMPVLQDTNPGYTESEEAIAETLLSEQKALLSGTGVRGGVGMELEIRSGIHIGFHHHFGLHLNFQKHDDSLQTNILSKGYSGIHTTVHF